MRIWQSYKSRKYLLRIVLSVTVLIVAMLFFGSLALQMNAERSAVRMQQEASRKVMSQIRYNVSYMTDVLNNLALSLYMDPNIEPLLSLRDPDEMTVIRSMNTLKQSYLSSSFLHSILVYNGYDDVNYAVGELGPNKPDAAMADGLAALLKRKMKLPRMRMLPMRFGGTEGPIDFFSLVLYQNFDSANDSRESALVVNIKPEWLYDNLQAVNGFAEPDRSGIFMLDEDGNVLMSGSERKLPDREALQAALNRQNRSSEDPEPFGSFASRLGGRERLLVSYLNVKDTGWTIVSVQPYSAVLGGIREMRVTSFFVMGAVLLLAVALSVLLGHRLYKPVERLVRQIGSEPGEPASAGAAASDELSFAANAYRSLVEKLQWASSERERQKRIVRNDYLRTLIASSPSLTAAEFADHIAGNGLGIDPDGPFRLVLIRADGLEERLRAGNFGDRSLYHFAIGNIAEEIMRPGRFRCEIADMRSDHLVMLVSGGTGEPGDQDDLIRLLRRIQEVVDRYYKLSLTMSVSDPADGHEAISQRYAEAIRIAMYKLLFGHGAIVTPGRVRSNDGQLEYVFPEEAEKKLAESVRANRLQDMESAVDDILNRLAVYHYDHIVHGILHTVDLIKAAVRDVNRNRVVTLNVDLSSLSRQVLEKETMGEISALFRSVCRDIYETRCRLDGEKHSALIDAIKEMIELNYRDRNLSLQGIAAMLHLTPAYVGRMFKNSEQLSVGEYLNEVRLQRARGYLETRSFSVKEIMELVGYVNESTFFKLFKKSFGVTPKEYRLKRALEP
ncbi:helix-turn-helix domain-containing protein [Cohnella zeiphila]|uniref:Helix-turn-helix domain-containing protein n=1 Tax=Cohnella zeiphila TaxID=2761120 RepID=A0A7X0SMY9_9BACL|nr:helix-turn-helix domain-containing protein [Cohnella zeiphila]MBB6732957.1 helix-turn-helix domain-containing protein [Cohnella zeiphila]